MWVADITISRWVHLPLSGGGDGPVFTAHCRLGIRPAENVADLACAQSCGGKRRPPPGLIFHTDRGIEYYANAFRNGWAITDYPEHEPSGQVTDNAFMESFFIR